METTYGNSIYPGNYIDIYMKAINENGQLMVGKLVENIKAFVSLIIKTKPSVVKGKYMLNASLSSTMGPGIKIDINDFDN